MIQFWLRFNYCADSRLLSSKTNQVIKYVCMQIRVLLCPELGTPVSLIWNAPVIKCACLLKRFNCALNRELLCFDIQTCMTKREQHALKGYVNTILLYNSTWLIMINIIIDKNKDKFQFSGKFRQVQAALYFTLLTPVLVRQNPANRIKD